MIGREGQPACFASRGGHTIHWAGKQPSTQGAGLSLLLVGRDCRGLANQGPLSYTGG